jgi:hypothetical protein
MRLKFGANCVAATETGPVIGVVASGRTTAGKTVVAFLTVVPEGVRLDYTRVLPTHIHPLSGVEHILDS